MINSAKHLIAILMVNCTGGGEEGERMERTQYKIFAPCQMLSRDL